MTGRYPDFLGIGAQRAGSSWLHRNLKRHPHVWLPPKKELHYFDQLDNTASGLSRALVEQRVRRKLKRRLVANLKQPSLGQLMWDIRYFTRSRDDQWYASLFPADESKLAGDITPAYGTLGRDQILHVQRLMPRVKVLLVLRDPIERAWSHATLDFGAGRGRVGPSRDELMSHFESPESRLRGDYVRAIRNWRSCFHESQMFIGFFEDIAERPGGLVADLCSFLGLPAADEFLQGLIADRINASRGAAMPDDCRRYLERLYKPQLEELRELLHPRQRPRVEAWLARFQS